MEEIHAQWHKDQAEAITAYQESIKTGEVHLAQLWWETGEWLNRIYGINTTGKINKETEIPLMDLSTLGDIYKMHTISSVRRTMNRARRFHRMAPSPEQRDAAIKEYGTWTKIYEFFCAGYAAQPIHPNPQPHMMNVPDVTVYAVANRLGDYKEAQKAIRAFMQAIDPEQVVTHYLQYSRPYAVK